MTRPERLLSELHGYAFTDRVEEGHRKRMVQLLARVSLDRAAELMPGPESHRVIRKLRERSPH